MTSIGEFIYVDRLLDVAVAARVQAAIPVALHRVRGQRDYRNLAQRRCAAYERVAVRPSMSGILKSMRIRSGGSANAISMPLRALSASRTTNSWSEPSECGAPAFDYRRYPQCKAHAALSAPSTVHRLGKR